MKNPRTRVEKKDDRLLWEEPEHAEWRMCVLMGIERASEHRATLERLFVFAGHPGGLTLERGKNHFLNVLSRLETLGFVRKGTYDRQEVYTLTVQGWNAVRASTVLRGYTLPPLTPEEASQVERGTFRQGPHRRPRHPLDDVPLEDLPLQIVTGSRAYPQFPEPPRPPPDDDFDDVPLTSETKILDFLPLYPKTVPEAP